MEAPLNLPPPMNRDVALERLDGDVELLDELLALMVDQSPTLVHGLRHALSVGDSKAVQFAAHSIKGSASNLEATVLTAAAARLELMAGRGDLADAGELFAVIEAELARLAEVSSAP